MSASSVSTPNGRIRPRPSRHQHRMRSSRTALRTAGSRMAVRGPTLALAERTHTPRLHTRTPPGPPGNRTRNRSPRVHPDGATSPLEWRVWPTADNTQGDLRRAARRSRPARSSRSPSSPLLMCTGARPPNCAAHLRGPHLQETADATAKLVRAVLPSGVPTEGERQCNHEDRPGAPDRCDARDMARKGEAPLLAGPSDRGADLHVSRSAVPSPDPRSAPPPFLVSGPMARAHLVLGLGASPSEP